MFEEVNKEILTKVFDYLKQLPEGTETTTFEVAQTVLGTSLDEMEFLFELDYKVRSSAYRYRLILDSSQYDDLVTGLPFHIGYIVKKKVVTYNRKNKKNLYKKEVITQMVEGIIGEEPNEEASSEEKEKYQKTKTQLSGRALEYLMFKDDE